jgi:hypothetical protein
MNYELAKQLKETGFNLRLCEDMYCECSHMKYGICDDRYDFPTLSELIEACGDEFDNLTRDYESSWKCNYYSSDDGYDDEQIYSSVGKTPEEAVAKLWLKLHK